MTDSRLPATIKPRVGESLPDKVKSGAVGKPADLRATLFEKAGITEEEQARATRATFDKAVALLKAQTTKFFADEGKVTDERTVEDNASQGRAVETLSTLLGLEAPKASRTVVVKHEVELPEWARPDRVEAKVIDAQVLDLDLNEEGKDGGDSVREGTDDRGRDHNGGDGRERDPS